MCLRELEKEIERARGVRDSLKDEVDSLRSRILYYKKRGERRKVAELKKELRVLVKRYEEAKRVVKELIDEWREERR